MDSKQYTVGTYFVDRLRELGLAHLFAIAGDYTIDWLNEYVQPGGIRIIEEVNEWNAGCAADGYARLTGIGAICVTYSAGSLAAVNAIAGAFVERVPVVLINGTPSVERTLKFEQTGFVSHHFISTRETDLKVFEPITAAAVRLDNAALAPTLIDYALSQCAIERRPVYIELLQDVIHLECERPMGTLKAARAISNPVALQSSVERIRKRLQNAANPLLWIGVEVDRYGAHDKAQQLVTRLKVPYVTELLSKAILSEDDPLFAGVFDGLASSQSVQELAHKSDFVLALGVWLTDINTLGWMLDFDKTAFVAMDSVKDNESFDGPVSLADFMDGLLAGDLTRKRPAPLPRPSPPAPSAKLEGEITYQGFYDFIPQYIDDKTIVGSDPSLNYFGTLLLKVGAPRGYIAQPSYSAIGYIAPAATGVCLARPGQRVMMFSGDGGFQMAAQCLSTQTRFGLNPIIFVIDNGVYGVEQWLADASVFASNDPFYKPCELHPWNYSKLADVFGCKGWKATTYAELKDAMVSAMANQDSPSIVQVVVTRKSIPTNAKWKSAIDAARVLEGAVK
jgi:indolepyruvate decarboxylase